MKRCPICARQFPAEQDICSVHGLPLVEDRLTAESSKGELTGLVLEERYRLGAVIGAGGMGVVYEAEHLRVGRRCAVKLLLAEHANQPKMRMRFFREVRATSRVHHPNVVEILDFGEHPRAGAYMVMEFLEGRALTRVIDEAPLPLATVVSLGAQLCAALGATHAMGLLHRDLKPGNVIVLPGGQVKVVDFGLVKPLGNDTCGQAPKLTTEGMVLGTPWYMSPEQFRGEVSDARADVYSLGVILYEMLVGKPPFTGGTPMELLNKHLNEPVPMPRNLSPPVEIPGSAEVILLKALAKQQQARYQSASELADALLSLAEEQGVPVPGGAVVPVPRPCLEDEDDRKTQKWKSATPVTSEFTKPLMELQPLFLKRSEAIVDRVTESLLRAFPRYQQLDRRALEIRIRRSVAGALDVIGRDSAELDDESLQLPEAEVPESGLSLTEVVTAHWLAYTVTRPVVADAAGGDFDRFQRLSDQLDQRLLPYFFHLVDRYVSAFQGQLQRSNEALGRRNEELQELRASMSEQVEQSTRKLADAERLKAQVMESISSGMVLVERGTRRVMLWNHAMERMSGIVAGQVVGRTLHEVEHLVEGVPFEEFADQIRFRKEVGLRKLRMSFEGKSERTIYVSGQPFHSQQGEHVGTLFVLEDVTEREQIIESLGRYLSRDLVDSILSRPGLPAPEGEERRAVVLSAQVRHLNEALSGLDSPRVVKLLSEYVRAVARAVFQRGGTIERIAPEGLLAYFAYRGESTAPAVEAAVELSRRLARLSDDLQVAGAGPVEAGVGLHAGDVLVLDVGGERLMVRTVVGNTARTAESLRDAAGGGEILVSPAVAEGSPGCDLGPGPSVAVPGAADPLQSARVLYDPAEDLDTDPVTHEGDDR